LKVGRSTVYQLFNTRNFPVLKLGRKLLVRSDLLDRFLNDNFRAEDQEHYA
jgi:excisionase family DNA binding protein